MLSVMLLLIGLGVIFFIVGGVNWASMEKLLQEGDYTRTKKKTSSITGVVSTVYWCVAAARVPGMQPPRPFLAGKLGHMACGGRAVCGGDGRMQRIGRAKKIKRTHQKRESGRFRFPFLSLLHRFRLRSAFSRWLS